MLGILDFVMGVALRAANHYVTNPPGRSSFDKERVALSANPIHALSVCFCSSEDRDYPRNGFKNSPRIRGRFRN